MTLIELLLVAFLLGLVVVALEPAVPSSIGRTGLEAAARRVRSDLLYARELAMMTGVNHGANFVGGQPYVVYRQSLVTPVLDPLTRQSFSQDLTQVGRVQVNNSYQAEFDRLGRPVIGGGGSVTLSAPGGGSRTVRVQSSTGLVEIQ